MMLRSAYRKLRLCGYLISLLVLMPYSVTYAQDYYDPGVFQKIFDRKPLAYQPSGVRMGSLMLKPGADIAYEHDDNIFYSSDLDVKGDSITHARPWAEMKSDWGRHALNINAYSDIARYKNYSGQDFEDLVLSVDGRIDVRTRSMFKYKASAMKLHEDRSSPDGSSGIKPNEFDYDTLGAGYEHTFNRVTASIDYEVVEFDFENNIDEVGDVIDNQDRNRTQDALNLKVAYELSPQRSLFLGYGYNTVDYDQKFDDQGYERSSDGYNIRSGIDWNITGIITGDLYLQYYKQDYSEPSFKDISSLGLGGSLDWTPTELTNVYFHFSNTPQETTKDETSGYNRTLYSVRIQHEFRRNLLGNVGVSYTNNDYEFYSNIGAFGLEKTEFIKTGLSLSYLFNRNLSLSGGYSYRTQKSNLEGFEYKSNRWFLSLGLEL